MSSAPVDCPLRLANGTASARRWRALTLLGIVVATACRSSGLAVPGSRLTIACRSQQVFGAYRLKFTRYLAYVRQCSGSWRAVRTQGPDPGVVPGWKAVPG